MRRHLHDDVRPTLASARLKLAAHRRHLPEGTTVDDNIDQLADAISGVRRVSMAYSHRARRRRPHFGTANLVADLRQTTGMHIIFVRRNPAGPTSGTASTAYHVVAEALRPVTARCVQ